MHPHASLQSLSLLFLLIRLEIFPYFDSNVGRMEKSLIAPQAPSLSSKFAAAYVSLGICEETKIFFFMEGEEADNLGIEQLKKVIFELF